jgi:hypothetical protein
MARDMARDMARAWRGRMRAKSARHCRKWSAQKVVGRCAPHDAHLGGQEMGGKGGALASRMDRPRAR